MEKHFFEEKKNIFIIKIGCALKKREGKKKKKTGQKTEWKQ